MAIKFTFLFLNLAKIQILFPKSAYGGFIGIIPKKQFFSASVRLSHYCTPLILLQRNIAQQCAKYTLAKKVATFHCQVLAYNFFLEMMNGEG